MRKKYVAIFVCAAAILSAAGVSVTGQQEPLPPVTPRQSAETVPAALSEPAAVVFLASDPIREFQQPSLEEAARDNDYVTFDALYRAAKQRGQDVSRFAALHELWTWAISDPLGAFYGRETYMKLARAYPGYVTFISDFAITDSNGNTFWPTSETRIFLISRATAGEAPRMQLAESSRRDTSAPAPTDAGASAAPRVTTPKRTAPASAKSASAPATTKPVPATLTSETIASTPHTTTPATGASTPLTTTPATIASTSATTAPASTTPATTAPAITAPVTITPEPAAATVQETTPPIARTAETTTTPAVTRRGTSLMNRGILLLVLGLIAVGLLAVIFRAPKEEEPRPMATARAANVEPIRKAAAPADEAPRATGSHG